MYLLTPNDVHILVLVQMASESLNLYKTVEILCTRLPWFRIFVQKAAAGPTGNGDAEAETVMNRPVPSSAARPSFCIKKLPVTREF